MLSFLKSLTLTQEIVLILVVKMLALGMIWGLFFAPYQQSPDDRDVARHFEFEHAQLGVVQEN